MQRLFAPGVGVLLGYVVLLGNPWVNRDLVLTLSDSDSALRLVDAMVSYPSWQVDVERFGPFLFWLANLRTVLFVGLAMAGLSRVPRWLRETTGAAGVFVATVGAIALSALAAGLGAAAMVTILVDEPAFFPSSSGRLTVEFFAAQLGLSASFGVLFGLVLGAVVVAQRQPRPGVAGSSERAAKRRVNAPKSFW